MADYKISIGTELDVKGLNSQVKGYKGDINVGAILNTSNITKTLAAYKAAPLNVNTKLSTTGITKAIQNYKAKKEIKVNVKPVFDGIDGDNGIIKSQAFKTPLQVQVKLNWAGVAKQISDFSSSAEGQAATLNISAKLDDGAISDSIKEFNEKINKTESVAKIKVGVTPDFDSVEEKVKGYTPRTMMKVNAKVNKSQIDESIKNFQTSQRIKLKAELPNDAVEKAITSYKVVNPVPVTIDFKVGSTKDVDDRIASYKAKPLDINARLIPASKDFTKKLENTPVKVSATVEKEDIKKDIEAAVGGYTPTAKMPVNIKLTMPKDVNEQIRKLGKPTETIDVGVKLDNSSVNEEIALFQPSAVLGVKTDLMFDNVDEQIRAYVPSAPIKVDIKINDDIDSEAGKNNVQEPIKINVKLDREKINEQIRDFKTKTRIKIGAKLDFASHEGGQKGIPQQIKDYKTKTKMKVGVQLDKDDIAQQIVDTKVSTPVKLGVELDESNVWTQIDNIKNKLQELGNIKIDFGAAANIQDDITRKTDGVYGSESRGSYVSNITQGLKEVDIVIKATESQITNLGKALKAVGFNNSSVESITNEFKELGVTVTNVTSRLNSDGSVRLTVKGLDQFKNAVTYVNNIGSDGKLGAWSETVSKDVNKVTENFNKLKSLAREIGNLKIDIFKSDDANEIKRMTDELNRLQGEYRELFAGTQGGLKSGQINQLNDIVNKSEAALSKLKKEYAETRAELAKEIRLNFSGYDAEVKSVETSIRAIVSPTDELKVSFENVKNALKDMQNASSDDALIEAENRLQKELKETEAQLRINQSIEQQYGGTGSEIFGIKKEAALIRISNLFEEGSRAANKFGAEARELQKELNNVGSVSGIDKIVGKISNLEKKIKKSNLQTKTVSTRLKEQISRYSQYLSVASVIMYATQAMISMFEQVKLIDSAMTELKKVTDETDESYNRFLRNASQRSKELGTTIDGLVASTADFARLGYGFEESQGLAEVANIYAVVGDEIEGVEGATKSLISTLAAFKDEASGVSDTDFAMEIVDKFNEVSNNFAISSGGIGSAMERSASSLRAANNTIDESIALITAANTVVQNPDSVGRLMPTIKMAISVKLLRRTRPRKDFISIFNAYQLGRVCVFLCDFKRG